MDGSPPSVPWRLAAAAVFALMLPFGCTSNPEAKAPSDDKTAEEDKDKDANEAGGEDKTAESAGNEEATPEPKPEPKPEEYPPPPT